LYQFTVPGRPQPKERAIVKRTGHAFTPPATRIAESRIKSMYKGPKFEGPVEVHMVFLGDETRIVVRPAPARPSGRSRADIDNLVKLVLDALQGVAYDNDNQVVYVEASK